MGQQRIYYNAEQTQVRQSQAQRTNPGRRGSFQSANAPYPRYPTQQYRPSPSGRGPNAYPQPYGRGSPQNRSQHRGRGSPYRQDTPGRGGRAGRFRTPQRPQSTTRSPCQLRSGPRRNQPGRDPVQRALFQGQGRGDFHVDTSGQNSDLYFQSEDHVSDNYGPDPNANFDEAYHQNVSAPTQPFAAGSSYVYSSDDYSDQFHAEAYPMIEAYEQDPYDDQTDDQFYIADHDQYAHDDWVQDY